MRNVASLLFLTMLAFLPAHAADYELGPEPSWVKAGPAIDAGALVPGDAPLRYLLLNTQINVGDATQSIYRRIITRVEAQAGVEEAAKIEISFDASYERLTIHSVRLHRDSAKIDRLKRKHIEILRREKGLEENAYDGRHSASIVIPDVRVGDDVEIAFTKTGQNPVFEGKFVFWDFPAAYQGPALHYELRLSAPAERKIHHRITADDVEIEHSRQPGKQIITFRKDGIPQLKQELGTPPYYFLSGVLQLSEYEDWQEVAQWSSRLFSTEGATHPNIRRLAEEFRNASSNRDDQIRMVLDFTQKDVRYFADLAGPFSHRPYPAQKTLTERTADCKGKVMLALSLLRELGIPAHPVLASTLHGHQLRDLLPSPIAFNHVVVAVETGNGTQTFDVTRRFESGSLESREIRGLGFGLRATHDTTEPSPLLGLDGLMASEVHDHFHSVPTSDPVTLTSTTTFRDFLAEEFLRSIDMNGKSRVLANLNQRLRRTYPTISTIGDATITRSSSENAAILVQKFHIDEFWAMPETTALGLSAAHGFWILAGEFTPLSLPERETPWQLNDVSVQHSVELLVPEVLIPKDLVGKTINASAGNEFFEFNRSKKVSENGISDIATIAYSGMDVSPRSWPRHQDELRLAGEKTGGQFVISTLSEKQLAALGEEAAKLGADSNRIFNRPSETEVESGVDALIYSAIINSGNLPKHLLAEAYRDRGQALDWLARQDEAADDFAKAIEIKPGDPDHLKAAIENAVVRLDVEAVERLAAELEVATSGRNESFYHRGIARFFDNDYEAALTLMKHELDAPDSERQSYSQIYVELASLALSGSGSNATPEIPVSHETLPDDWPYPIVRVLRGDLPESKLLKRAKRSEEPKEQLTEAYFYLALRDRILGDHKKFLKGLKRVLKQDVKRYVEYGFARTLQEQARH